MTTFAMTPFLRGVLIADAAASAASGALMTLGARALAGWLGLPAPLLLAAGSMLLPYALFLLWLARRPAAPTAAVGVVIACNLLWAADCAALVLGGAYAPTRPGMAFAALQALVVVAFAELQWIGLRRARAAASAR